MSDLLNNRGRSGKGDPSTFLHLVSAGPDGGPPQTSDTRLVVLLARVDNMETSATEGQRSIRVEVEYHGGEGVNLLVERAIAQAGSPSTWDQF